METKHQGDFSPLATEHKPSRVNSQACYWKVTRSL